MILRAAARHKSLTLLDFLAPSLLTRGITSTTFSLRKSPVFLDSGSAEKAKVKPTLVHVKSGLSNSQIDRFNRAIAELKSASRARDLGNVIRVWTHLHRNDLLHFLPPSQINVVAGLLANVFTSGSPAAYDIVALEDMALQAAVKRSTDALNKLLVLYLKQDNPDAVIRLYERFMGLLGENEIWDESQSTTNVDLQSTSLPTQKNNHSGRLPFIPGRVELLLAVTAAHAERDAFQDALRTCLRTVVRFHHHTTQAFLQGLQYKPDLQAKLSLYVDRLSIARLVARPYSLSKYIMDLSNAPSIKLLESLYQSVIAGLSGPDAYLAPDPSKTTPTRSVAMTEACWTSFLTAFLKRRRRDLASKLWSDMSDLHYTPGVSLWTAVIDSYESIGAIDEAVGAWNMMRAQGIKPEVLSYRALISSLFKGRRVDEATQYFKAFQKLPFEDSKKTLSVYNTVLHGLLARNQENEAYSLLQTMESEGPTPDLVTYNTFLAYQGRRGDFKALASLVGRMAGVKVVGDVFTFSTILSALLKAGRDDAPDLIINIMRKQGVEPNVAIYSAMIDHQIQEASEKSLAVVMRMLHWMDQDPNTKPNSITYTSILAGLCRGKWMTPEKTDGYIKDIDDHMRKRGVEFNLAAYHMLIQACLEDLRPQGLTRALGYYQELRRRKFLPTHSTWYILLRGLYMRRDWEIAEELVTDMYQSGHVPSGAMKDLIGKIKRREGA